MKTKPKMKMRNLMLLIVAILALLFVGYNVLKSGSGSTFNVKVAEVSKEEIVETLYVSGTLEPNKTQNYYGEGKVESVKVEAGDKVASGDTLATYSSGVNLTASSSGTVAAVNVQEGVNDNSTQQNKPSIVVADLSKLKARLELSKSDAEEIKVNQQATIKDGDNIYDGKVSEVNAIATEANAATGKGNSSLGAVVTFDNPSKKMIAGFDVDVEVMTKTVNNAIVVPVESVKYDKKNKPYVFIVEKGRAKKVGVTVGVQSNTKIEIKKGLEKGQEVVISPDDSIVDGVKLSSGK